VVEEDKTVKIEVHRSNSANLKLFLDTLGFKCLFGRVNDDWDSVTVLPDHRIELLRKVRDELERSGHLPYQYVLSPQSSGRMVSGARAEFVGKVTQQVELQNVSGRFRLILFETDSGENWVWKCYGADKEFPVGYVSVTGRVVCKIDGLKGEALMLFSHARIKEFKNEG
jgi:hypothetical protein